MRKVLVNFLIAHITIVLLLFLYYKEFSALTYINSSFIVGGIIVFIGLVFFVFSTGFFDFFTVSMRKVFTSKRRMADVMSMRTPSEIFSGSFSPLVISGFLVLLETCIVLLFYYT